MDTDVSVLMTLCLMGCQDQGWAVTSSVPKDVTEVSRHGVTLQHLWVPSLQGRKSLSGDRTPNTEG
jgi:hypothetical protein